MDARQAMILLNRYEKTFKEAWTTKLKLAGWEDDRIAAQLKRVTMTASVTEEDKMRFEFKINLPAGVEIE